MRDAGNAVKRDSLANSEGEAEMSILSAEGRGGDCPKVSVVVYSFTEEDEIFSYLEAAMNQDYPDYEVIIVNEGGAETTASLAKKLKAIYPERLYVTFIPEESRSLSRRKLAFTVGIKAASGEVVLTTTSNCRIPSRRWLTSMMRPFVEGEGLMWCWVTAILISTPCRVLKQMVSADECHVVGMPMDWGGL